jgi:hypothetical protein
MSDKNYSHNANIQGVKFSWQKAVGSWQFAIFANCILPTFTLNYYQIMKRIQRNINLS